MKKTQNLPWKFLVSKQATDKYGKSEPGNKSPKRSVLAIVKDSKQNKKRSHANIAEVYGSMVNVPC